MDSFFDHQKTLPIVLINKSILKANKTKLTKDSPHENNLLGNQILPVDIVLAAEWWHKHEGVCFDPDFFFHPARRLEEEQKMEKVLYDRWGRLGLGLKRINKETNPQIIVCFRRYLS